MLPVPKYKIGDKVYEGYAETVKIPIVCPDCNDTRKCEIHFPNDRRVIATCPRCCSRWGNYGGPLHKPGFLAHYRVLTIASIRIDTAAPDKIEYMCEETSSNQSGRVYLESALHPNHMLAMAQAELYCEGRRKEDWVVESTEKMLQQSNLYIEQIGAKEEMQRRFKCERKVEKFIDELYQHLEWKVAEDCQRIIRQVVEPLLYEIWPEHIEATVKDLNWDLIKEH